ncbi:hypothetical protein [Listeria marthii]|uniref:hypothetical protein n=1 Tax=Listeria marthii TaxID=529731 RepID=UPI0016237763|nr:hypothetical protein [Listeria marthii]MBC2040732.1 hypothetical protein [Listeria marthii]MBF2504474.1 hypothetical protein [Listeria marthii]
MSRKLKKELRNRWYSELDFEINRSLKKRIGEIKRHATLVGFSIPLDKPIVTK